MLQLLLCSLVTILPDYLLRRQFQGKRIGQEITFFTVWYELRWGLTLCAMLTITLTTIVFFYHPSTSHVVSAFRTVTIVSEGGGRVAEVFVRINESVKSGQPIFRLDDSAQEAAAETARRRIAEVDAESVLAASELAAAIGTRQQAEASYEQTLEELQRAQALQDRGSSAISEREVERLQNLLDVREGGVDAAIAGQQAVEAKINVLLPTQKASAQAALDQAETEISKLTVYAGVDGTIQQFTLRPGDYVNPILRPAGILVPADAGRARFQAGFSQLSAGIVRAGGVAEMMCFSKPFTIVPMVITAVQDVISAGQVRPGDELFDFQDRDRPGTITVFMEPLYSGQADDIPPGSKCIANAYTDNHDRLEDPSLGTGTRVYLHTVDTVGIVHAAGLRIRALLTPLQQLVFSGS